MKGKKSTRSAFLTSLMSLVLCFAMLLGTTFAWFTDTASTAVNKIQAGTLDVQLLDAATNTSIEGQTLQFRTADDRTTNILWEPGCTYELPAFVVKNNGSLTLKYKIVLSGINGDAVLNRVIDWTMNGEEINATTEYTLEPGQTSPSFTIKGHMQETAGNEYQGLTIDGIAITVYATQKDAEFDSIDNSYDAGATYPVEIIPAVENQTLAAVKNAGGAITEYQYANSDNTFVASVPAGAVTGEAVPVVTAKKTDTPANITITAADQDAISYDISISNANLATAPATITLNVGKSLNGVKLYHNNSPMTPVNSKAEVDANGEFYYDGAAGTVTFATSSFSPFTIVFDSPVAVAGGVSYYDLQSALKAGGEVILLKDVDVQKTLIVDKTVTLDMNGKKLFNTNDIWEKGSTGNWSLISVRGTSGNLTVTGNGTFAAKENDCYAIDLQNGAKCTIENGTFVGNIHAVYVSKGELTVNGGEYSVLQKYSASQPDDFVLNCLDENYRNETAKITVTGGKFYNYNPSNAPCENPKANFVSDGHGAVKDGEWYKVIEGNFVKTSDELDEAINAANGPTTIYLAGGEFSLKNGIAAGKNITFVGTEASVGDILISTNQYEMNYQNDATLTFEGLTIQGQTSGVYGGIAHTKEVTYRNCTINGKLTLYSDATFTNCTLNNDNDYSIWTWGAKNATFTGCTFNSGGKALLLYGGAGSSEDPTTNLKVTNCTFNDNGHLDTKKAAIETGNDYGAAYNLTVNNVTVNGFAVNPEGTSTESTIWANKNSMDQAHLNVVIDGVDVY